MSGALSATGKPVVANDPHREVGNPSLRYIVHLIAPGWNVIGAGEAPFVGVAIGHNDRLGVGPHDRRQRSGRRLRRGSESRPIRTKCVGSGGWEPLRIVREEIRVKGQAAETVELKFSRHGPVFYEDRARHRAYALRSALLEPGTARVPRRPAARAGAQLPRVPRRGDVLEGADREPDLRRRRRQHLLAGVGADAEARAEGRRRGRAGCRCRAPARTSGTASGATCRANSIRRADSSPPPTTTSSRAGFTPPVMFKTSTNVEFDRITRLLQMIQPGRSFTLDDHRRMQLDAVSLRARVGDSAVQRLDGARLRTSSARAR